MRFLGRLASDTTVYAVDFAKLEPHNWHYHEQDELITVVKGSMQQKIGTKNGDTIIEDRILVAGDAVFLAKGQWHAATPLEPDTQVVFTIKGGDGIYRAFEADGRIVVGPGK